MSKNHLCYGMRRLNPFQGNLQVSELGHARAVSLDDVRWEVQVRCAQPEHTWRSTNEGEPLMRCLRFGAWSLESGLRQVPLSLFLDIDLLLSASGALVEVLAARLDGLPFAPTDHQQLWLLVGDGLPVALLTTSVDAPGDAGSGQGPWVTTARSDHIFKPHRLAQRGIAVRQGPDPRPHASLLERLVAGAANHPARTCWLERDAESDGSAAPLQPRTGEVPSRLGAKAFPPLLLRERWPNTADEELVLDYLD